MAYLGRRVHVVSCFVCLLLTFSNLRFDWRWITDGRSGQRKNAKQFSDSPLENDTHLFGFFYQVYKFPKATLETLKSLYQHMPDAPVYLVSSAGYHYDPLAERFPNVHYVHGETFLDIRKGRSNLSTWFDRVRDAALWCNCSYLIFIEDDLHVQGPVTRRPPYDAGGQAVHQHTKQSFAVASYQVFESRSHWSYNFSGMAAGSYVRTKAYLDAYAHIPWTKIQEMLNYKPRTIGAYSDITLGVILMDRGYKLLPWDQVQTFSIDNNSEAAFVHGDKHHYDFLLSPEDGNVIIEPEDICMIYRLKCKMEREKRKREARLASARMLNATDSNLSHVS